MFRWLDPLLNPMACLPQPAQFGEESDAQALLARLEAMLRQPLREALSGEKRSLLRGQGLDFAELREYTPGDDIRKIDWNVFARTLTPHIREYQEEKQLMLWLVVDCTASMHFGKARTKRQLATELAGLFGLMAARAGHRLGAMLIGNTGSEIISPQSGMAQVQRLADRLLASSLNGGYVTDPLHKAFQQLAHLVQKHATVILLSDFLSFSQYWEVPLGQLSRCCQLLHVMIGDPVEQAIPAGVGLLPLIDPETGITAWLDTSDAKALQDYQVLTQKHQGRIRQTLEQIGIVVSANTTEPATDALKRLLGQSLHRRRAS